MSYRLYSILKEYSNMSTYQNSSVQDKDCNISKPTEIRPIVLKPKPIIYVSFITEGLLQLLLYMYCKITVVLIKQDSILYVSYPM